MKSHVQIGLLLVFFLALQCGAPVSKQKRVIPVVPYQDKRFSPGERWNSISVRENQLAITVKYLEPEELALFSFRFRPPHRLDFAPLFTGKYINYADEGYEDMLIAYNL